MSAVFSIEGRGLVFQGIITHGIISKGMQFRVSGADHAFRISDVDAIHGRAISTGTIGLVVKESAADLEALRNHALNQVLEVK